MAELTDPDLHILRVVNGWGASLSGWVDTAVTEISEHGLPLILIVLCGVVWLRVRRRPDAPQAVATVLWAPLSVAFVYLANAPISSFVERPRPFLDHADIVAMVEGKTGFSFVSDHAAAAMGMAVALLLVHRKLGLVAVGVALLQGFGRVLTGVHYPTDVVGGLALGTAVVLLLFPLALWALTPVVRWCSQTRALWWVAPGPPEDGADGSAAAPHAHGTPDLTRAPGAPSDARAGRTV